MIEARYFDGRSSGAHAVRLGISAGQLWIVGDGFERRVPASDITVSEPGAARIRSLSFRDGGSCDAEDAVLRDLLEALGHRDSAVARGQLRWWIAIAATALLALLAFATYLALPQLADRVARWLPVSITARIGREAIDLLDRTQFEPSRLEGERQDAIRERFERLAEGDALPAHRILFREAPRLGANAFAFPNGDLVLTDALAALAEHDDELVGVIAHEVGHLAERHALRSTLQRSAVAAAFAVYLGDLSSLGAGVSAFLLQAKYSRDFEREADAWAERFLRRHEIDPARLAAILERMERASGAGGDSGAATGYLSTHPVTGERIRELGAP